MEIVMDTFGAVESGEAIKGFQGEFRWLSNFWPADVEFNGKIYSSVEHAYQAAKILDVDTQEKIRNLPSPGKAKRFAKTIKIRQDWDNVKLQIMEDLLRQKFQNPEFKNKLLATDNAYIEETNSWGDTFWGVSKGTGQNYLGKLIMKIRKELSKEPSEATSRGLLIIAKKRERLLEDNRGVKYFSVPK